jgi:pyruvate formate lyase activating enzyme
MPEPTSTQQFLAPGVIRGRWWHRLDEDRVRCDPCPHGCRLREGRRGFRSVPWTLGGGIALATCSRSSGFRVGPIGNEPLLRSLPGASAISFGTAGRNLGCRFRPGTAGAWGARHLVP